jgi:hypothetical protein
MSFLASLVWGLCSVIMVTVICSSGIVFYSLHIIDSASQTLPEFVMNALDGLPTTLKSVPFVADVLNTERRVAYAGELDIEVRVTDDLRYDNRMRAVATVVNNGDEVVSLLCVRVVVSDRAGNIVSENIEFVATPFPIDDDLPGPLWPGQTRRVATGSFASIDHLSAEYEISEIRVWVPDQKTESSALSSQSSVVRADN